MKTIKKAIFLDRDGTLNIEKDYLYKIEDFQFEDRAMEGLKILKDLGYLLIVVTNQAGIGRGYYTEEDLTLLNNYIINETEKNNCKIDKIYFCPHHPTEGIGKYKKNCTCRKPNIDMITEAIQYFDIDKKNSYVVGDKISDIQLGINSEITPVLVRTGYGKKTELQLENMKDIKIFDTLYGFSIYLKNKNN
jgi:D,D-heptose 1,7-bisphosphate phosphatase